MTVSNVDSFPLNLVTLVSLAIAVSVKRQEQKLELQRLKGKKVRECRQLVEEVWL